VIEVGLGLLNLRNILLQNKPIKNIKPRAKNTKPQKPNSLEKLMGDNPP
jgi:hypothetical protein